MRALRLLGEEGPFILSSRKEVEKAIENQGEMPVREILRHGVRYFFDGVVLGTGEFVNSVFSREQARGQFGEKRISGARKMHGAAWGELRVLRELQKEVIHPPPVEKNGDGGGDRCKLEGGGDGKYFPDLEFSSQTSAMPCLPKK